MVHNSVLTAGRSASVLHDISVFMKFKTLSFKPLDSTFVLGQMSIYILIAAHLHQHVTSVALEQTAGGGGMCDLTMTSTWA